MSVPVRILACFLAFITPLISFAATGDAEKIADILKDKGVFLRGAFIEDSLSFDAAGNLKGQGTEGPFWFSAIKISEVHLSDSALEIKGHRNLLISIGDADPPGPSDIRTSPISLGKIRIEIEVDPAHPDALASAVKKVLAGNLDDALSGKTNEDRNAALDSFASFAHPYSLKTLGTRDRPDLTSNGHAIYSIGDHVTAPRLVSHVDPQYSDKARREKLNGVVVLVLIIEKSGIPSHIRIVKSLVHDLDQNAMLAVSQYRFAPATLDGQPVSVKVNVEVNFRIF